MPDENQNSTLNTEQANTDMDKSLLDIVRETVQEQPSESDKQHESFTEDESSENLDEAEGQNEASDSQSEEIENQESTEDESENEEQEEESESEEDESKSENSLLPPKNFSHDEKNYFNSLDEKGKKIMLKKWGNLESGYNEKYKNIAKERKQYQELDEIYEPVRRNLDLNGVTPVQYTRQLIAADRFISENPIDGIKWLINQYNVDPAMLNQGQSEQEYQDPSNIELTKLKESVNRLESEISNRKVQVAQKSINEFKNSRDSEGNLKYPHFDKLEKEMSNIYLSTGVSDLEKLYYKALRLDDELYQKSIDLEVAKRQKELQKKADLTKAKSSKMNVRSSKNAKASAKNIATDLKQILREEVR